jgi:fimbrial isopeptide formation D2 family protein/LPXTG-motif cell wall-anchored protein
MREKKRKEEIMKNFKKMMALIVAAVMIIGTMGTMTAFAGSDTPPVSEAAYDQTITISGLEEGDSVDFYQILRWVGSAEEGLIVGNVDGWDIANEAYKTVIPDKATLTKIIDGEITSEIAGDLSRAIKSVTPTQVKSVAEGETSVTIDVPESQLGLYMAIIDPKNVDTVYNPVFASADYNTGEDSTNSFNVPLSSASYYDEAAAKKSKLDLEKTAENEDDYNGDDGDTTAVGDTLTFTVETTIPGYGETFDAPCFVVKDVMTANLELNPSTVTVVEPADAVYTVVGKTGSGDADKTGYGIVFDPAYLKTLTTATPIKITYDATVVETENPANVDKENNTVTIEYSHDPTTEDENHPGGEKEYKKDVTNHYTFSIDADNLWKGEGKEVGESGSEIIKIAVDRDGNPIMSEVKTYSNITTSAYQASPLAGCSFALYKTDGHGHKLEGDPYKTVDSDEEGRIKFEGLDAGEYILVETKAPAGYVKDNKEHVIVIDAEIETKKITEYYDQAGNWYEEDGEGRTAYTYDTEELLSYTITFDGKNVASHTFVHESSNTEIKWSEASSEAPASIHNTKGVELPSTGGMGTRLFYIIGAILVVGAGVLLVTRRRVNAN